MTNSFIIDWSRFPKMEKEVFDNLFKSVELEDEFWDLCIDIHKSGIKTGSRRGLFIGGFIGAASIIGIEYLIVKRNKNNKENNQQEL